MNSKYRNIIFIFIAAASNLSKIPSSLAKEQSICQDLFPLSTFWEPPSIPILGGNRIKIDKIEASAIIEINLDEFETKWNNINKPRSAKFNGLLKLIRDRLSSSDSESYRHLKSQFPNRNSYMNYFNSYILPKLEKYINPQIVKRTQSIRAFLDRTKHRSIFNGRIDLGIYLSTPLDLRLIIPELNFLLHELQKSIDKLNQGNLVHTRKLNTLIELINEILIGQRKIPLGVWLSKFPYAILKSIKGTYVFDNQSKDLIWSQLISNNIINNSHLDRISNNLDLHGWPLHVDNRSPKLKASETVTIYDIAYMAIFGISPEVFISSDSDFDLFGDMDIFYRHDLFHTERFINHINHETDSFREFLPYLFFDGIKPESIYQVFSFRDSPKSIDQFTAARKASLDLGDDEFDTIYLNDSFGGAASMKVFIFNFYKFFPSLFPGIELYKYHHK